MRQGEAQADGSCCLGEVGEAACMGVVAPRSRLAIGCGLVPLRSNADHPMHSGKKRKGEKVAARGCAWQGTAGR